MAVTPSSKILPGDMTALAAVANGKTSLQTLSNTHYPYAFPDWFDSNPADNPKWLTELNKLRADIYRAVDILYGTDGAVNTFPQFAVSQFWPTGGFSEAYQENAFFYEDTGNQETVTIEQIFNVDGNISFSTINNGTSFQTTQTTGGFRLGGTATVLMQADFVFAAGAQASSAAEAAGLVTIVKDLGIGTAQIFATAIASGYEVQVVWHVNDMVSPGDYTATVSTQGGHTPPCADFSFFQGGNPSMGSAGYNSIVPNPPPPSNPTISVTYSNPYPVNGIDRNKRVMRIDTSTAPNLFPPLMYAIRTNPTNDYFGPPFPQPTFGPIYYYPSPTGNGLGTFVTPSQPGFWAALTNPIAEILAVQSSQMPWNTLIQLSQSGTPFNPMLTGSAGTVTGTYNQNALVEGQSVPQVWGARTNFIPLTTILDGNGNFQYTAAGGLSGNSVPVWSKVPGATTADSGISWVLVKLPPAPVAQGVGRLTSLPRYPVYWLSETNPMFMPPTVQTEGFTIFGYGEQWLGQNQQYTGWQRQNSPQGKAYGWWIYSVALNRIGTNTINGAIIPTGAVSVTLGCIRNGAFVAFGTYSTGQSIQVLWPIFTSDALVYECSERVDVQATAIEFASTGSQCSGPIAAAFYNDTLALLGLLS